MATQLGLLCTTCGLQTIFPSSSFSADQPPNYSVNKTLLPALGPSAFYSLVHEVQKSEHSQRIHINHKRNGQTPPPRAKLLLSMDKRAYDLEAPAADPTDGIVLQPDIQGSYENIADGEDSLAADGDSLAEGDSLAADDDNIADEEEEEEDEVHHNVMNGTVLSANDSQSVMDDSMDPLGRADDSMANVGDSTVTDYSSLSVEDSILGEESLVADDPGAGDSSGAGVVVVVPPPSKRDATPVEGDDPIVR